MAQAAMQYDYSQMRKSYRDNFSDEIRVAIYGRVSTLHDEQLSAFGRQLEWYEQILTHHTNWKVVGTYEDKTSGTTSKRKGFKQMIADAKQDCFDLILTREVCRFARNTVDSLMYTRMLKEYDVEVYFASDNIWSMDSDGELRLTIFSALAQDESRKVSERVYNGQMISRKNGTLYGNGNILGYNLVRGGSSVENTYVIDEEQAKTVRRIFELYLQGEGMKAIASKLIAEGHKGAYGSVNWSPTKVSRIISNKTYCGYIGYNKSRTVDFLSHKRVNNTDRSTYEYVKGNFEPIISEEDWLKAQDIARERKGKVKNDKIQCQNPSREKWTKKLVCSCGKTYKRYKWRANERGDSAYGFQCRNQVENRKRSYRIANGLDGTGYCDVPSICEWKLDYMFYRIFHELFDTPEDTLNILYKIIADNYEYQPEERNTDELDRCKRERMLLESRSKELLVKYLDGKIDDAMYQNMKQEFENKLDSLELKIAELEVEAKEKTEEICEAEAKISHLEIIQKTLFRYIDFSEKTSEKLVEKFVERVVPYEGYVFKWYINLAPGKRGDFEEEQYDLFDYFTLRFDGAQKYRKERGTYLRPSQWHDLKIEIYIRI